MADDLLTRVDNRVGYISFNRPETMNGLTPDYLVKVIAAVNAFEADDGVRVIVLSGAGKAFSSGGDKKFLQELLQATAEQVKDTVYKSFLGAARTVKLCRKPTVAAVNGPAVGGGCEIAVACDFRLVARGAFFQENWIDLGIIPPLGGMFLLPRLIGLERAANMVMRGQRVYAEEAVAIGLASEVVEPDALTDRTREFAEDLARRAPAALAIAKAGLRRGMESTLAGEWEFNLQAQAQLITGPDFREAVAAMAEKRRPEF